MTDLDNTQIINADESLLENASTIETVGVHSHRETQAKIFFIGSDIENYQWGGSNDASHRKYGARSDESAWRIDFSSLEETIIGRSNPSTLVIAAPVNGFSLVDGEYWSTLVSIQSLSKQHAKINLNNGQYFITDLGSSNKTFHNKVRRSIAVDSLYKRNIVRSRFNYSHTFATPCTMAMKSNWVIWFAPSKNRSPPRKMHM